MQTYRQIEADKTQRSPQPAPLNNPRVGDKELVDICTECKFDRSKITGTTAAQIILSLSQYCASQKDKTGPSFDVLKMLMKRYGDAAIISRADLERQLRSDPTNETIQSQIKIIKDCHDVLAKELSEYFDKVRREQVEKNRNRPRGSDRGGTDRQYEPRKPYRYGKH